MNTVVVVDLTPHEVECIACGAIHVRGQGLAMREGEFLEHDDPGEWGGFDACRRCFEAHQVGGVRGLEVRLAALREGADMVEVSDG